MWEFRSGMRLQFGHCANPSDYENFMSNEYTHVAFDELTAFEEEQYEQITTRKRTTDPVLRRMMRCVSMSNPMMRMEDDAHKTVILKNPHWVRERFVDPAPQGRVMLKQKAVRGDGRVEWLTRIYLPAKLRDNPNKEFVEQYERSLIGKPPHIRKALLEGDWYVTAGSHYADVWNPSLHTCSPHRIPDDWPQFRCMDWGFKKPGCVYWMAVDPDDNLIVHKEYTFQGKTDKYVAHDIRDIERELGLWRGNRSGITGPADTQIWEKRGDSGKSKAEVFAEHGITWTFADKRSRQRNSERLYARLQDHGEGTTTPGIVFFTSCKMALKTIPSIQSDPDNQECPMDGGDDHWHDAVGYGVAYASHGRSGIGDTRQWDDYDDDDSPLNASRGRNGYGSMY
jgi:hypothetical protein